MAEGKRTLTIDFKPTGDEKLIKAIQRLARAQRTLENATKKSTKSQKKFRQRVKKNTVAVGKLQSVIGIYRNKMLLASFAVSIISKAFVSFVKMAGVQETSVRKLADVFGSEAAVALNKYSSELQKVIAVGDETINNAMAVIGAFGASEAETKSLIEATADLSAGIGLDLNTAALLVAKTIGSTTDALTRYGVGAQGATEQSEKIANIVESIEEKFGGLAEELAKTTEGQLKAASHAFGDLGENVGQILAPAVLLFANGLRVVSELLSTPVLQAATFGFIALGISINATTIATTGWTVVTKAATAAQKLFNLAVKSNPYVFAATAIVTIAAATWGWVKALQANSPEAIKARENAEELKKALEEHDEALKTLNATTESNLTTLDKQNDLIQLEIYLGRALTTIEKQQLEMGYLRTKGERDLWEEIKKGTEIINQRIQEDKDRLAAEKAIAKEQKKIAKEIAKEEEKARKIEERKAQSEADSLKSLMIQIQLNYKKLAVGRELTTLEEMRITTSRALSKEEKKFAKWLDESTAALQAKADAEQAVIDTEEKLKETVISLADAEIEGTRRAAEAKIASINEIENRELESLRNTFEYKKATDKQKAKMEKDIVEKHDKLEADTRKKANKRIKLAFRAKQALSIAETIMNTQAAAMMAMKQTGIFGFPLAAIIKAMGAVSIALIASQKAPVMQYGGLVGGNRHSQGGTMLEAERGEYVVSRKGVEAAGIEALNRINAGGGGTGGISVVINNPIIGKDTIEDEIIPQIKEAIRRGSDIGI